MNTALYIARRYLFARKSHNVINVISAISAVGMAVGTAALILILSVYNGFDDIIRNNMSDLDPDVLVCASRGKFFEPDEDFMDSLKAAPGVAGVSKVLEDNVFVQYGALESVARAKGVETMESGAEVGATLASRLQLNPAFITPLDIYYPDREGKISMANPAASLRSVRVWPTRTFSVSADVDASLIILPLGKMEDLLEGEGLASGIEIRLEYPTDRNVEKFMEGLSLPEGLVALDRYRQHPSLYKMMRYEKLAIFGILIFVVIIIAFNIFGSLSMLIIEKKDDVATLQALGASGRLTRRIFLLEGWLISLAGLAVGVAVGVGLALLQQHFGLVKMPGNYLIESYPVILQFTDILWTVLGVGLTGLLIALGASRQSAD